MSLYQKELISLHSVLLWEAAVNWTTIQGSNLAKLLLAVEIVCSEWIAQESGHPTQQIVIFIPWMRLSKTSCVYPLMLKIIAG